MLIQVLDGNAVMQKLVVAAQEAPVNKGGVITATGISQTAIAANANRAGMFIQNIGANAMYVNELGAASSTDGSSFMIPASDYWPKPGFPVVTSSINIVGTLNDKFVAREW